VVKFWQKRACNYANPFMRENTRGYRRKTVNLHVELVSDVSTGVDIWKDDDAISTQTTNDSAAAKLGDHLCSCYLPLASNSQFVEAGVKEARE
jgi:hypothetical protein